MAAGPVDSFMALGHTGMMPENPTTKRCHPVRGAARSGAVTAIADVEAEPVARESSARSLKVAAEAAAERLSALRRGKREAAA